MRNILIVIFFNIMLFVVNVSIGYASMADKYISILSSGKYQINYELTYNVNESNHETKSIANCVIARDKSIGLNFYKVNLYNPSIEKPYNYFCVYDCNGSGYTGWESSKDGKIKDVDLKVKTRKKNSDFDQIMLKTLSDHAIVVNDDFFSLLGRIAEVANIMPNYKVNFIGSGNEIQEGMSYQFEEYQIVYPYKAKLKLYYLNNELVKCIKIYNNTLYPNNRFPNVDLVYNGYVVADIKKFSSVIEDAILTSNKKK